MALPSLRKAGHDLVDLALRGHVDAPRGLVQDQEGGDRGEPARDEDLLLVTAAQVHDQLVEPGRLDPQGAHRVVTQLPMARCG